MSATDGEVATIPRLAGVVGWPISHSRSPALHSFWLHRYGLAGNYVPLAVQPQNLERALRALPALGFAGVNVTVPHKEAAAVVVDRLDEAAARTGSVNMVTVCEDGSLEGASTDGHGFLEYLNSVVPGRRINNGTVVIVGAGGAARAIADALLAAGETRVRILNRTDDRSERLATQLGRGVQTRPWAQRNDVLGSIALVVNATTQGMIGQPPLDLDLELLPAAAIVNDIVYTPLETPLLAAARARGNQVVDGLGMLLHQARPAFARWFGVDPEIDDTLRAAIISTLR